MYKVIYEGSMKDGFTIKNIREEDPSTPEKPDPKTPEKPTPKTSEKSTPHKPNSPPSIHRRLPQTGDGENLNMYALILMTLGILLMYVGYKYRRSNKVNNI